MSDDDKIKDINDRLRQRRPPPDFSAEVERLARLSPWDYERQKKEMARRLGLKVGALNMAVASKRRELPPPPEAERLLGELNGDHSVVIIGARTRVLRFEDVIHFAGGEPYAYRLPSYLTFDDFRNYFLNRVTVSADGLPFAVNSDGDPFSIGQWWLAHPDRRTYPGVTFLPGGEPIADNRLNLWSGFGVEPERGDWSLMQDHILEILAAGDTSVNTYVLSWLADAVQNPNKQAEAALVFIGGFGTGKGLLGRAMCRIFGQHGRHISSSEHMTGKFNAHMQQCCFLFADEAVAPGDKKAEGAIKRLITEDTLFIEPKGVDPFEIPNRLHVLMASNHEQAIPAGEKERRYVVQKVNEARQQDEAWFAPIYAQMRDGGLQAMLYDLLDHDLGRFAARQIVRTKALAEQQEESLSPLDEWFLTLLQNGVLGAGGNNPNEAISNAYEEEIEEATGGGFYGNGKRTRAVKREGLYDLAKRNSPRLGGASDAKFGRYLRKQKCIGAWIKRRRGWRFPKLSDCRDAWVTRFPDAVWEPESPSEWTHGQDGDDEE